MIASHDFISYGQTGLRLLFLYIVLPLVHIKCFIYIVLPLVHIKCIVGSDTPFKKNIVEVKLKEYYFFITLLIF